MWQETIHGHFTTIFRPGVSAVACRVLPFAPSTVPPMGFPGTSRSSRLRFARATRFFQLICRGYHGSGIQPRQGDLVAEIPHLGLLLAPSIEFSPSSNVAGSRATDSLHLALCGGLARSKPDLLEVTEVSPRAASYTKHRRLHLPEDATRFRESAQVPLSVRPEC